MSFTKNLKIGDTDSQVESLQTYLKRFGYLEGNGNPAEGIFEDITKSALQEFQRRQGLNVTGELDLPTRDLMNQPRCGVSDTGEYAIDGRKWPTNDLTYGFHNFTSDISQDDVRWAIRQAFDLWSGVAPLRFTEIPIQQNPDIKILFANNDHSDGSPFDGPGGVLAHAFYPPPNGGDLAGDAHFDEAETWVINPPPSNNPRDLFTIAAHEFGHSLGLGHSNVSDALMYAYYKGPRRKLHEDDIAGIQSIYPRPRQSSKSSGGLTPFSGKLYVAFVANNNTNDLLICSSSNGQIWTDNIRINQAAQAGTSPGIATFNNRLWVTFIANNHTNDVLVCSSDDGNSWTNNTRINQAAKGSSSSSFSVFNNRLWIAFVANNDTNNVLVCSSADGNSWTNNIVINQAAKGSSSPSLTVFNGRLWVAFVANNSTNDLLVCSSADGHSWTNNTRINQTAKSTSSPSLVVFNNRLWVAFIANNDTNDVLVCSSADGQSWTNNTRINQAAQIATSPALAVFNNKLWISFIANNHTRNILICSSTDGQSWSDNVPV